MYTYCQFLKLLSITFFRSKCKKSKHHAKLLDEREECCRIRVSF